jgi:hypothetical protein
VSIYNEHGLSNTVSCGMAMESLSSLPVSSPVTSVPLNNEASLISFKTAFFSSCYFPEYSQLQTPQPPENEYTVNTLPAKNDIYFVVELDEDELLDSAFYYIKSNIERSIYFRVNIKIPVADISLTDWIVDIKRTASFVITIFGMSQAANNELQLTNSMISYRSHTLCDSGCIGRMVCILNQYFKL